MKKQNIFFMLLILLILIIGSTTLVREEKKISYVENRELNKFQHFTLNSYMKGEFQNKLESAMSDQFIGSETIKLNLNRILKTFDYNKIPKKICSNRYVKFTSTYANYDCDDYILHRYENYDSDIGIKIENIIKNYNTINKNIDTYYYFIPTSKILNFENNNYNIDIINLLENKLKEEKAFDYLKINNYDEYKKYFYKTDHHWNYMGSYQGYKDIIRLFNKNAKILEPSEEVVFEDIIFYGSLARFSQILDYKENLTVYKFNFPKMEILTNRTISGYGAEEEYFKGIFSSDKFANHYGLYYGDDYAEVSIRANSGKKNLLIIGNSFSNSVNKLIATHFNETYDVDLRHYNYTFNETFNIKKYIEENDIDKVLFIMDYDFLLSGKFDIRWED